MITPFASFFFFQPWYVRLWNRIKNYSNRTWNIITHNPVIFVLLLIYIFFNQYWENLIRNRIIDNFLCHFSSNWVINSFFIAAAVSILVFSWKNRGKDIKQSTKVLCLIAIGFWVYYRCFHPLCGLNESRFFIDFKPLCFIKYVDIVPLYAICTLISPYIVKRKNHFSFNDRIIGGFIKDSPIGSGWQDFDLSVQKRHQLAKSAIHKIIETYTGYNSFTFGINAQWGAGKTTFMNMMKSCIVDDKDIIIIDFNPWLYAKGNDLVSVFFDELSKTLKEYDKSLAKNIINYSKMLSAFDTKETKIISSLVELVEGESSMQDTKQHIIEAINKIQKKIVVFIDDLDRLDAAELMEMFKLIRNVSDFPLMYFVAAYDKTYIVQCLKQKMNTKEVNFVEKIFQVEFHLPPYSNEEIRQHLYQYIIRSIEIEQNDKKELKHFILEDNKGIAILKSITNLREVIRIVNSFSSSYIQLKKDVYVVDLLLFELFKTKYSSVYELFEQKKDEVLELNADYYLLYQTFDNDCDRDGDKDKGTNSKSLQTPNKIDLVKYIKSHHETLHINDLDERSLLDLLNFLFSPNCYENYENNEKYGLQRINHKDCLDRYFRLSVFESELSDEEFKGLFNQELGEIKPIIRMWSYHRSYSLCEKIKKYDPKNETEYRSLTQILFYFITLNTIHKIENESIDSLIGLATKFISDKKDAKDFIEKCMYVDNNYCPSIASYLSYLCNNYGLIATRINHLFDKDELIKFQCDLFHFYSWNHNIDEAINCFNAALKYPIADYETRWPSQFGSSITYYSELIKEMRNYVENGIITDEEKTKEFIQTIIVKSSGTEYTIIGCIEFIWGSWDGLYDYFFHLDTTNKILDEFKDFLNHFKENFYKPVGFPFKEIKPRIIVYDDDKDFDINDMY